MQIKKKKKTKQKTTKKKNSFSLSAFSKPWHDWDVLGKVVQLVVISAVTFHVAALPDSGR